MKAINLTTRKFSRLLVLAEDGRAHGKVVWLCRCDCGKETRVQSFNLRSGNTKSCGCLRREAMKKTAFRHGYSYTRTHKTWSSMLERCRNPNNTVYAYYGGRGIQVCDRWQKFEDFLADMGERPIGMSIDRIDSDGNYELDNCRWATRLEQRHNRRDTCRGNASR